MESYVEKTEALKREIWKTKKDISQTEYEKNQVKEKFAAEKKAILDHQEKLRSFAALLAKITKTSGPEEIAALKKLQGEIIAGAETYATTYQKKQLPVGETVKNFESTLTPAQRGETPVIEITPATIEPETEKIPDIEKVTSKPETGFIIVKNPEEAIPSKPEKAEIGLSVGANGKLEQSVAVRKNEPAATKKESAPSGKRAEELFTPGVELELANKLPGALPGFEVLSDGQKMLVVGGLMNKLYSRVTNEAVERFNKEKNESGLLGKVWKGARKKYLLAKFEKEGLAHLTANTNQGLETFMKEGGPEFARIFMDSGLNAYRSPDGKKVITDYAFLNNKENGDPAFTERAREYNKLASEFADIPFDWGDPKAKNSEQKEYKKREAAFNASKHAFLSSLIEQNRRNGSKNPEAEANEFISRSETMLRTMSLYSAHPDAVNKISKMRNQSALARGMKDALVERLGFAGLGGATHIGRLGRLGASTLFGVGSPLALLAAPVTAGVIGFFRGKERAKEALRERDRLARKGVIQKGETAVGMGSAERHIKRLSECQKQLELAQNPIERQAILTRMQTYRDFAEAKLQRREINFGTEQNRASRQYELMRALHEAQARIVAEKITPAAGMAVTGEGAVTQDLLRTRVERRGAKNVAAVEDARKKQIRKEAVKSATYGAMFATAGMAARYLAEEMGWIGHGTEAAKQAIKAAPQTQAPLTPAEIEAIKNMPAPSGTIPVAAIDKLRHAEFIPKDQLEVKPNVPNAFPGTPSIKPSTFNFNQNPLNGFGNNAPVATQAPFGLDASHPLAHVQVSSRGEGQTLLDFRHSAEFKNLPLDQQAFFKANIYQIAEKLKGFRPGAFKESVSVGEGSEFGVTPDGHIYITDTLHGNRPISLGHFENGGFVSDDPESQLHYIHTEHARVAHEIAANRKTPEELGLNKAPVIDKTQLETTEEYTEITNDQAIAYTAPEPSPEYTGNEPLPSSEYTGPEYTDTNASEAGYDTPRQNRGPDPQYWNAPKDPGYHSSRPQIVIRPEIIVEGHLHHFLDHFFGQRGPFGGMIEQGHRSMPWQSYQHATTENVLRTDPRDLQPRFRPFVSHVQQLAERHPEINREQKLGPFLRQVYHREYVKPRM